MSDVLLVTSAALAHGEPGHEVLDEAFARRGVPSRWAVWDDPSVDWAAARLVCVRSTWDYHTRLPDFLGWAGSVAPRLVHGVEAFRWNTDKSYLLDLAPRVPTVPSVSTDDPAEVREAVVRFGASVVKPRVGAGGRGLVVVDDPGSWQPLDGPWLVQPLLDSVQREGETSVFVLDGRPVSQVDKRAPADDVRVHEEYGGSSRAAELDPAAARLAADAVAATTAVLGSEVVYGRVDLLRDAAGRLLVSEVEITEPGLYLHLVPGNAEAFAEAVTARL